MARDPEVVEVAAALRLSVGLLLRRLRQAKAEEELALTEAAALARLDRDGPSTSAALARIEQISPQSMGATLGSLQDRGLVARAPDPQDGRQIVLSVTEAGRQVMHSRRNRRTDQLARALASGFTRSELEVLAAAAPLLERLAEGL